MHSFYSHNPSDETGEIETILPRAWARTLYPAGDMTGSLATGLSA